jgi:hypothetical protein
MSILLGGNAGEIAFMLAGTTLGGRPPLNTRQLLLINMLTDMFPALAVALGERSEDDARSQPVLRLHAARPGSLGNRPGPAPPRRPWPALWLPGCCRLPADTVAGPGATAGEAPIQGDFGTTLASHTYHLFDRNNGPS